MQKYNMIMQNQLILDDIFQNANSLFIPLNVCIATLQLRMYM